MTAELSPAALPTRRAQPIILIRGFGGLGVEDEKKIAYQGFNDGTVYPQKRGENYIYEGLILRFMKSSRWTYQDATNVVGYYAAPQQTAPAVPAQLSELPSSFFSGRVVIDPGTALRVLQTGGDPLRMLWVFRYYDLNDRKFPIYGEMLVRLIDFIRELAKCKPKVDEKYTLTAVPKVNIIAHSMGGLIVREAVQKTYPATKRSAAEHINKIVTLGTPHKGISFQVFKNWLPIGAEKELEHFNPDSQKAKTNPAGWKRFSEFFPPSRALTVVGTNYRTYGPVVASWLNRLFSVDGEFGANYNRSDGLVKQAHAQLPGAPRTFVHKCHGGPDSLVTSREAFEVATRFFFGNIRVRLHLVDAEVTRGFDRDGRSEFYFGVSIKPRGVDFDLFHQSAEAENCYGPFNTPNFAREQPAFGWANDEPGLIWEGWLDTTAKTLGTDKPKDESPDIVMRLDFYVGERDTFGLGFSDNVVFRKQYYVRAVFGDIDNVETLQRLELHTGEQFTKPGSAERIPPAEDYILPEMKPTARDRWEFDVKGTGFRATLRLTFAIVPEEGEAK